MAREASAIRGAGKYAQEWWDRGITPTRELVSQRVKRDDEARLRWFDETPRADSPEQARREPTFLAGDSGLLNYRNGGKELPTSDFGTFATCTHLSVAIGSGWTAKEWANHLEQFVHTHESLLISDADQVLRLPPRVRCFVLDNLCRASVNNAMVEYSVERCMPLLESLLTFMHFFASLQWTCSAPAERWGIGSSFDDYAVRVREMGSRRGCVTRTGEEFWR